MSNLRPTSRVARGATYLFVQGFLTSIIGLVYFVILTHTLSAEEMGVFALLSFILALAQTFGTFALPSAAIKYIAHHLAENDSRKSKAVVSRVLQVVSLASIAAFLLLFIPADQLSSLMFSTADYAILLRLIAVCSMFTTLNISASSFLQGMQRIRDVALIGFAYTVISTSVGVYFLSLGWRLYAVVLGWLAGWLVASVAGLIVTAKYLGVFGKPYSVRQLWNFSRPLYISSGIGFWVGWVDQLLLVSYMSLLYGTTEAQRILGIYYVAIRASAVPSLFSNSIVTALFPQLSELYARQGFNGLKDAFRVSSRYAILIGFPLIIGLATLAYPIIILFAGWKYVEATSPLIIICISALIGTLGVAISPILMTLERTNLVSLLAIASVVLSAFFSYSALAILGSGMIGVAWARAFASIIGLVLSLYALTRYTPVSFDKEAIWKASVASALLVMAIVGLDLVRMFFSPSSYQFMVFRLVLLPVYVAVGGLAYFVSLVGLRAIKKRDVELLNDFLPKNLRWVTVWLGRIAVVE
jgi:O-antigen/teichoic acid export membrane protein